MRPGWIPEPATTGSCQCGAVRFVIAASPARSTVCHCRMCQRATGNVFAPLLEVVSTAVTRDGMPAEWASSDRAARGFRARCGTPLCDRSGDSTELMAGSRHPDFAFRPAANCATEQRRAWLANLPAQPDRPTPPGDTVTSHQAPE